MKDGTLDLANMTVEDLFQAKDERRKRLANLPFEQKIEIVKKLQSVSRAARAGLVSDQNKRHRENSSGSNEV
jgi:ribosomal protein L29